MAEGGKEMPRGLPFSLCTAGGKGFWLNSEAEKRQIFKKVKKSRLRSYIKTF